MPTVRVSPGRRLVGAAVAVAAAVVLLPHLPWVDPWGLVPIAQALVPLLCTVLLLAAAVLLLLRRWWAALALLLGAALAVLPLLLPPLSEHPDDAQEKGLTVLSLNVQVSSAQPSQVAAQISETGAAVVVLLEVREDYVQEVLRSQPFGADVEVHRVGEASGGVVGSVILSSHTLADQGQVPRPAGVVTQHQPTAVLTHPDLGPVRVAAVHPMPPHAAPQDWAAMLDRIGAWQREQEGLPLVLTGDFNASTAHPQLRRLSQGLVSASPRAWILPRPSWPVGGPVPAFTGIDHVLVRDLRVLRSDRFTVDGTDHAGVVAYLAQK